MRTIIHNARLVMPDCILENGWLLMENDRILDVGCGTTNADSDRSLDAQNAYLSPGFIDMHVHGAAGHDFMDGTEEAFVGAAKAHMRHGTTSLLPTTMSSTLEELQSVIACYQRAKAHMQDGPNFLGLHLEGPFLAPAQAGAQDPKFLYLPLRENYMPLLEAGKGDIRRVSAAVELEGALEMGDTLRERGVMAAIAHSDAEYSQAMAAFDHGYRHLTHFYSGMSSMRRIGAYRHLGLIETAYLSDTMTVEIIADGCHLPPELLRLIVKQIPTERISLITDAMRGACMPDGSKVLLGSKTNGRPTIVENGVAFLPDHTAFAGSVCTTNRCVRVMTQQAGVSLPQAISMITANPAKLLSIDKQKGALLPGMDADLCLFTENIDIQHVFVMGRQMV